jgi:hypothetical protein
MIFKELTRQDFRTASSTSNQVVDILQDDAADTEKRKRYQNWYKASKVEDADLPAYVADVTGDLRQVLSGLFQTVHDIDHTLQTANPLLDVTFGITGAFTVDPISWEASELDDYFDTFDSTGKAVWKERALMVNEKIDLHRQMASQLLGDRDGRFPRNLQDGAPLMKYPVFLSFRRLFFRDGIKRGTLAMRWYHDLKRLLSATDNQNTYSIQPLFPYWNTGYVTGLNEISDRELIITDAASADTSRSLFGGEVGELRVTSDAGGVPAAPFNTDTSVGLIFYDAGIIVLDLERVCDPAQEIGGIISTLADNALGTSYDAGTWGAGGNLDSGDIDLDNIVDTTQQGFLPINKRIFGVGILQTLPDDFNSTLANLLIEGTIDDAVDHLTETRLIAEADSNLSAITFQNRTKIKSMLVFCRIAPEEFNYSNNKTYATAEGRIIARSPLGQDDGVKPFSYITKVGLYDAGNRLLAVASLSRPVENGPDRDLTLRLRLDF